MNGGPITYHDIFSSPTQYATLSHLVDLVIVSMIIYSY